MNTKHIGLLIFLCIVSTINLHAMQTTPEMDLIAKKLSPRSFLYKIERGLYGQDLASQVKLIKSVEYTQNTNIKNLYQLILNTLQFALQSGQYNTSEKIKTLTTSQIISKYKMLQEYLAKDLIQIPSSSSSRSE